MIGKKLPRWSLSELEAVLDCVFEETVESTRGWRWLAPHEILAKQEALISKPEYKLVLKSPAFVTIPLGSVVEDEASVWL